MRKRHLLPLLGLLFAPPAFADKAPVPTAVEAKTEAATHFGAPFSTDAPPLSAAQAVAQADALQGKTVRLEGDVSAVCKKKGCWMQLDTAGATPEPMRVTFKDYSFFVPLDADGSHAIIEGALEAKTITQAMRRHYAEDGGATPEQIAAIEGDVTQLKFVATGVALTRPANP